MIKFEHSVFALPFAGAGALLAIRESAYHVPGLGAKLAWILVAMVSARSAAMAFNRLLDADIDARNPRTKMRHIPAGLLSKQFTWMFTAAAALVFLIAAIPAGLLSKQFTWMFTAAAALVFLIAAGMLNRMCLTLAPAALGVVFFYSFAKRFTTWSHLLLGFSLGIAPAAAWIALRGSLDPRILWLTLAVTLWTAGFDVIYSCQDYEFDGTAGLFSIPRRFGIRGALVIAKLLHGGMLASLAIVLLSFGLGPAAWTGIALVAILLVWEHSLVKPHDLSRVNAAFFTVNGYVSILFFLCWALDILIFRKPHQ